MRRISEVTAGVNVNEVMSEITEMNEQFNVMLRTLQKKAFQ